MLLLHSTPDPAHNDVDVPNRFNASWGRDNCIIWRHARHADFGPYTHTLSIRAVWGGVEYCHVNGRTIAVDDDNFLILNHGRLCSTSIRSVQPVESLTICFSPKLVEGMQEDVAKTIEQALHGAAEGRERTLDFFENLQPHDRSISPVLRFIRVHLMRGWVNDAWYDEQLTFLLARMQVHHGRLLERVDRLAFVRPVTRREVYRRVALATDFLHTNYAHDVTLDALATMAYLSKYHFLRLFTSIHGITPFAYLQRKRVNVAARLLESTRLMTSEIAASVGLAESTLLRQTRRWLKLTPQQIRAGGLKGEAA